MPQAVKLRGHVTSICEGECASRDKTRDLIKTKKPCPKIGFLLVGLHLTSQDTVGLVMCCG